MREAKAGPRDRADARPRGGTGALTEALAAGGPWRRRFRGSMAQVPDSMAQVPDSMAQVPGFSAIPLSSRSA